MLFSEIYGTYFQTVEAVLRAAAGDGLSGRRLTEIVQENAFAESVLTIPQALKRQDWPLLAGDMTPVLRHKPDMPLSLLQKRWLKALLLDPRIALFEPDGTGLEDVPPLYTPDVFVRFDQYADGDPYGDPEYIRCFREALYAVREKRYLRLLFSSRTGGPRTVLCAPYRMEYSDKDGKFRLLAVDRRQRYTVNMARVHDCRALQPYSPGELSTPRKQLRELVLLLRDERNALERVLLHFSHFEKETRKLDERSYQIRLRYDPHDETELLIRVLSFGPMLKVTAPDTFIDRIRERIGRQGGPPRPETDT